MASPLSDASQTPQLQPLSFGAKVKAKWQQGKENRSIGQLNKEVAALKARVIEAEQDYLSYTHGAQGVKPEELREKTAKLKAKHIELLQKQQTLGANWLNASETSTAKLRHLKQDLDALGTVLQDQEKPNRSTRQAPLSANPNPNPDPADTKSGKEVLKDFNDRAKEIDDLSKQRFPVTEKAVREAQAKLDSAKEAMLANRDSWRDPALEKRVFSNYAQAEVKLKILKAARENVPTVNEQALRLSMADKLAAAGHDKQTPVEQVQTRIRVLSEIRAEEQAKLGPIEPSNAFQILAKHLATIARLEARNDAAAAAELPPALAALETYWRTLSVHERGAFYLDPNIGPLLQAYFPQYNSLIERINPEQLARLVPSETNSKNAHVQILRTLFHPIDSRILQEVIKSSEPLVRLTRNEEELERYIISPLGVNQKLKKKDQKHLTSLVDKKIAQIELARLKGDKAAVIKITRQLQDIMAALEVRDRALVGVAVFDHTTKYAQESFDIATHRMDEARAALEALDWNAIETKHYAAFNEYMKASEAGDWAHEFSPSEVWAAKYEATGDQVAHGWLATLQNSNTTKGEEYLAFKYYHSGGDQNLKRNALEGLKVMEINRRHANGLF
jgi:hypothetical protein